MKTTSIFIALFMCFLTGCNVSDAPDPRTILNRKYDNKTIGLSLQFPTGWVLATDQKIGDQTADLVATSVPTNGLAPNVSVLVSGHSGSSEFSQILPQIRTQLRSAFPDLGNYSDTSFLAEGAPLARVKYTATVNGNSFKFMQILIINRSKDITITYTDAADRFDANQDIPSIDASMRIY